MTQSELQLPRVGVMDDDVKTKQYLLDNDFVPRPDLTHSDANEFLLSASYRNRPSLPFRVATVMKNASGVQLTYRGSTHLPGITPKQAKLSKSSTVRDLQNQTSINMTRPKASSIQET